jgi:threonine dehydrogenase-like Zn-dependent dehydrogenase
VIEQLVARGEIGGRTVQVAQSGEVECQAYPVAPLREGEVRVRTLRSAVSPGTELSYLGRAATNVYLRKIWEPQLRLFLPGSPAVTYPIAFGYRSVGQVVESRVPGVPLGTRVYGKWRHTEFVTLPAEIASEQRLPDGLSIDDGVDLAHMVPICLNAVAYAEGEHAGRVAVVFGAGPVGLILAQALRATGAAAVHVVDRLAGRLAIARGLGLEVMEAGEEDVAASLKRALGAEAVHVAFECTGSTAALNEAIRAVRRGGTVVAAGFYQGEARGLFLGEEFHHNGVQIRSAQIGNLHPSTTYAGLRARGTELALAGALVLGGLPWEWFPVEEARAAFAALARPNEVLQVGFTY